MRIREMQQRCGESRARAVRATAIRTARTTLRPITALRGTMLRTSNLPTVSSRVALLTTNAALLLLAAACSGDDSSNTSTPPAADAGGSAQDAANTTPDSGHATLDAGDASSSVGPDAAATDTSTPVTDAAGDSATPVEAAVDFCSAQTGLAFCDDFDQPWALEPGGIGFDTVLNSLVNTSNSLSISTLRAVSAPDSLLVTMIDHGSDAKVAKTITQTVAAATYEYDIYIDQLPMAATGTFASDFQFTDTNSNGSQGADQFGFRVAIFSKADGTFDHLEVQHNAPSLPNTPDTIYTVDFTSGAWHHLAFAVAFSASGTPTDGGAPGQVSFQTYVDHSATPAVDVTAAAPFVTAPFARISAGIVYAFDSNNKNYVFSFDDVTLKLQ
jgi:hypothetical protein